MKFRKKPVVIEAHQVPPLGVPASLFSAFMDDGADWEWNTATGGVRVKTLEGVMQGNVGDWIIRGVKGEFYPCKDDIFQATYEVEP
jgi:hypothetical protein